MIFPRFFPWISIAILSLAFPFQVQAELIALPANAGGTGLFDMPSARTLSDWNMRFHYSRVGSYTVGAVTTTFLPRLEISGRFTKFSGEPGLASDKALDFKINLLKEDEAWPAITVGATDIHGTALFSSRYIVASKHYGPFDVSVGIGDGILAGDITAGPGSAGSATEDGAFDFLTSGFGETRFFGGLSFRVTENLTLVGEYSSIDYEKLHNISEPAEIPVNFGLKYRWNKSIFSLSYQQGRELAGSFSTQFPLGPEGMVPWRKKPFRVIGQETKQYARSASNEELAVLLQHEVAGEGFSNVRTSVADAAVWVEIENPTYLSNVKAVGRALRVTCNVIPARIEDISVSVKFRDVILVTMKLGRQDFEAYLDDRLDTAALLEFMEFDSEGNELRETFMEQEIGASVLTSSYGSKKYVWSVLPRWKTFLSGDNNTYSLLNKFSLQGYVSYFPWPGGFVTGILDIPLYNNISSSITAVEKEPVRTDTVRYLEKSDVRVETLAFDQIINLPHKWLGRVGIGFFESAYGGVALEAFRFFDDGRFGIGLESELVKKRDFDSDFAFQDDSPIFRPAYLNIYYGLLPELGLNVGLKLGRFLAGDWGGRLDVSRTYKYFTMGAWYTVTNTDDFTASYNQGYHDKGIYLVVPFSVFKDHDNPLKLLYSFRPWGRDTGQTVSQINSLYPMANRNNISDLKRNLRELKD